VIGLAVDPDADRLVLVHRSGEPVSEEKTVVLAVESVLRGAPGGTVVVNASTTAEVELVANRYGGRVFRSPVGEINVVSLMRASDAIIGGEGSGGVIYPACHWGRDSLVGATLVLSLWHSLSEQEWDERLLGCPFAMGKRRLAVNGDFPLLRDRLRAAFGDAPLVWDGDGLRFAWRDRWVHIRPSNTEPIVRVVAESPSEAETAELLTKAEQILRGGSDA
jgi:phosphomannomutase